MGIFKKHLHPLLSRTKQKENDPNHAFIDAIDTTLKDVEKDTVESKIHSSLKTARDWSLTEYGTWFGVKRRTGESDTSYRRRIVNHIDVPRGTNQAIKWAVRNYLVDPTVGVEVSEPFKKILILNKSRLNSSDHLMGYDYRFAVVYIEVGVTFDEEMNSYLQDFVPAGVKTILIYNPTIPRTDITDSEISASLFTMQVMPSYLQAHAWTGLIRHFQGRLTLGDASQALQSFVTDKSKMNSEDTLTGTFTHNRGFFHSVGIGRDITPTRDMRIGEFHNRLKRLDTNEYKKLTELTEGADNSATTVSLNTVDSMYQVWNIGEYIHKKYLGTETKIPKTREAYAKIFEDAEFTLSARVDQIGRSYEFQRYNFRTRNWETTNAVIGSRSFNTVHTKIENPLDYLSDASLMVTRIKTNRQIELELDYIGLDYRVEFEEEVLTMPNVDHIYGEIPLVINTR